MKILKKEDSREKGEEETKSMPHAPVINTNNNNLFTFIICFHSKAPVLSITVIYQYSFFNTPTVFVSRISLCRSRRY
jgi:hypothetical protein